jgi:hypothetical protein
MAKSAKKSIDVEVPELGDLALDPAIAKELDRLCAESRALSAQIKRLEDGDPEHGVIGKVEVSKQLKAMVEGLEIPERVLGEGWDLRRQVRVNEKIDPAKLKLALLHAGLRIDCPKVVPDDRGTLMVCPDCQGTGVLEGLRAAQVLVDRCTDRTETVSVSVYARTDQKEKVQNCPDCGMPLLPCPGGVACINGHGF